LRLFEEHLAEQCTLELVTHDEVPEHPAVRVHQDVQPGDPRLLEILGRTDVFVFPSPMDQSPNAVLEAMAMGLPVVALRVGALPEMVEDGITGFVVPPDDDAALLAAIRRLVDDHQLRRSMGAAARERAAARYDVSTQTDRLLDVLREARRLHSERIGAF
jgi:glycosyltransferase involved in cell wall biosynthesis